MRQPAALFHSVAAQNNCLNSYGWHVLTPFFVTLGCPVKQFIACNLLALFFQTVPAAQISCRNCCFVAHHCPPHGIQFHAPCKLPPAAKGSAFAILCFGPVGCVVLRDTLRFSLIVNASLLVTRTAFIYHRLTNKM